MIRMRRRLGIVFFVVLVTLLCPSSNGLRNRLQAQNLAQAETTRTSPRQGAVSQRAPKQPGATSMSDGNSLMEREAALTLKEQEMKKLEQSLDSRIKQLEATRKGLEAPLARKKTEDSGRYKKMLKVYKSLRPEEAAALMDKLDEEIALEMLNQMDQKTAAKLIPYLNQARVLKWTRLSLKEN
jgi:flagellar motility protein MotE (MotC chaperone)